ncbi:hypothetical protein [Microbispora sitophila]|uniref:hypothetical protein n=1 Tax=Microbispora sitophila TaxID=2771537 RepID=UPI001D01C818|nr:hypothetical protein [Microbispora sitophila]
MGAFVKVLKERHRHLEQAALQRDQPDLGVLFDDMAYADGDAIPVGRVRQPRVEAEIAFVLRSDVADGPLDAPQVRDAIEYGVAALEICGSRIAEWDIAFTVAATLSGLGTVTVRFVEGAAP